MNWFIINEAGKVVDTIVWDGDTVNNPYNPGAGLSLVQSDVAGIGWTYANGVFSPPPPTE